MDDPGEHGMLDEAQKAFKEAEARLKRAGMFNKFCGAHFSWILFGLAYGNFDELKQDTEDGKQECQQVATVGKFNIIWNFVGGICGTNMGLFRISLMQTPMS